MEIFSREKFIKKQMIRKRQKLEEAMDAEAEALSAGGMNRINISHLSSLTPRFHPR